MKNYVAVLLVTMLAICGAVPYDAPDVEKNVDNKGFASSVWDWIRSPFSSWYYTEDENDIPIENSSIVSITVPANSAISEDSIKIKSPRLEEVVEIKESTKVNCDDKCSCQEDGKCDDDSPVENTSAISVTAPSDNDTKEDLFKIKTVRLEDIEEQKASIKSNCNDQTCTTTYCKPDGKCINKTCNIYDTNMKGECQEYAHLKMSAATVPTSDLDSLNEKVESYFLKRTSDYSSFVRDFSFTPSLYSILGTYLNPGVQNPQINSECRTGRCAYNVCDFRGLCSIHICQVNYITGLQECYIQPDLPASGIPIKNQIQAYDFLPNILPPGINLPVVFQNIPSRPSLFNVPIVQTPVDVNFPTNVHNIPTAGAFKPDRQQSISGYTHFEKDGPVQSVLDSRFGAEESESTSSQSNVTTCKDGYCIIKDCVNGKCTEKKCDLEKNNCVSIASKA